LLIFIIISVAKLLFFSISFIKHSGVNSISVSILGFSEILSSIYLICSSEIGDDVLIILFNKDKTKENNIEFNIYY
jgi:hypothetical protein